jgi:hypothetical protein
MAFGPATWLFGAPALMICTQRLHPASHRHACLVLAVSRCIGDLGSTASSLADTCLDIHFCTPCCSSDALLHPNKGSAWSTCVSLNCSRLCVTDGWWSFIVVILISLRRHNFDFINTLVNASGLGVTGFSHSPTIFLPPYSCVVCVWLEITRAVLILLNRWCRHDRLAVVESIHLWVLR